MVASGGFKGGGAKGATATGPAILVAEKWPQPLREKSKTYFISSRGKNKKKSIYHPRSLSFTKFCNSNMLSYQWHTYVIKEKKT